MTLKHRSSSRLPLSIIVNVFRLGRKVASTHTININPFGAFIELPATKLATDDFVEMHFFGKENNKEHQLQKGLIMHRNDDGIGVLFAYDSDEFRNMLISEMADMSPSKDIKLQGRQFNKDGKDVR